MSDADQPVVRIYSNRTCTYCLRAKLLLKRKGVAYEDIAISDDKDLWAEMRSLTNRNTVPQIFIGEHHIGGYDDLAESNRSGELDTLLGL